MKTTTTTTYPQNSEDLRHLPVCSVDPPGCKDIDDALHVRPLPNGRLEVRALGEIGRGEWGES